MIRKLLYSAAGIAVVSVGAVIGLYLLAEDKFWSLDGRIREMRDLTKL